MNKQQKLKWLAENLEWWPSMGWVNENSDLLVKQFGLVSASFYGKSTAQLYGITKEEFEKAKQEANTVSNKEFKPTHTLYVDAGLGHSVDVVLIHETDKSWVVRYADGVEELINKHIGCELHPYQSPKDKQKLELLGQWRKRSLDHAYDNVISVSTLGDVFEWLIDNDLVNITDKQECD